MLFVLGVGCLVAMQACAFTVIIDTFPNLKVWHVSLGTAIGGFLVGLVYITPVSSNINFSKSSLIHRQTHLLINRSCLTGFIA